MAKHRRNREFPPAERPKDSTESESGRDATGLPLFRGLVLSLFLCRFFYVAESADKGDTLGIVGTWIATLFLWVILSWKWTIPQLRFNRFDLGVGLLVAGHVISALVVVATTGDKRAAVNLGWEWVGIGIGWYLLRQQSLMATFRHEMLAGVLAAGTSVALLGLYQHYIELPRMSARFGPMFDRLRQADPAEVASLRQAMADEGIPTEEPGLTLFEKRLRDSREPLGFFALANTLGGFLAVCLILAVVAVVTSDHILLKNGDWLRRKSKIDLNHKQSQVPVPLFQQDDKGPFADRKILILWMGLILIIGWSLLLTKSRTAWLGTFIGLALLAYRLQGTRITVSQLRLAAVTLFLLILAGWGLVRAGGLDLQVFTEAPKSLQYRIQYWTATGRMIMDHPWIGVGPGQFRWHYLFYKLPEASEEISDPHNLFLDVAANGGMIAELGLVSLCVMLLTVSFHRPEPDQPDHSLRVSRSRSELTIVLIGIAAAAWVVLLWTGYDDRLLVLLPASVVFYRVFIGAISSSDHATKTQSIGFWTAAIGLVFHLCGAGGIGMPAINLLLLSMIVSITERISCTPKQFVRNSLFRTASFAAAVCGLMVAWFWTGFQPVSQVEKKLQEGDRLLRRRQRVGDHQSRRLCEHGRRPDVEAAAAGSGPAGHRRGRR